MSANDSGKRAIDDLLEHALPHQRAMLGILAVSELHRIESVSLLQGLALELPARYRRPVLVLADRIRNGDDPVSAVCGEEAAGEGTDLELGGPADGLFQSAWPEATDSRLMPRLVGLAMKVARAGKAWPEFCSAVLRRRPVCQSPGSEWEANWAAKSLQLYVQLFFVVGVLTFFCIKICPQIRMMFEEFGIELSYPFRLLLQVSDYVVNYFAWLLPFAMGAAFVFGLPTLRSWLRRLSPFSWQRTELARPVERRLALALIAERDLDDWTPSEWELLAGQVPVLGKEAEGLSMTDNPEMKAWLLRWSAKQQQNGIETRSAFWGGGIEAVVTVVTGALVVLVCLAMVSSLVSMMNEMAKW